jgi:uncharacterized protein YceK
LASCVLIKSINGGCMRIILLSIAVSLTAGCSGLVDTIRKNQQKQQVYQQYASKYYASCQKEAFSYYPVAIVTETKTRKNLIEPTKTATCNRIGNTVNCRDTTIDLSGLSGAGRTTTSSYDANQGSRNNHIKSCIDNNLRSDSSYSASVRRVDYGGRNNGREHANYQQKTLEVYTNNQDKPLKNESSLLKYKLNGYDQFQNGILCYYGRNGEHNKFVDELPCSKFERF